MVRNCPICKSDKKKNIYTKDFNTKDTIVSKYDVVICEQCGFTFADNIPTQKQYNLYYEKMSKYEFKETGGDESIYFKNHAKNIADLIEPYLECEIDKILDIGCSTGALLNELKCRGYKNLMGVDPSKSCVESVRYKAIPAYQGTIDTLVKGKYNLIVLSSVLEHVTDLHGAISKLRDMLSEYGIIFINVPDIEYFSEDIKLPYQQFNSEHINYFRLIDLDKLMLLYNFDIIDSDFISIYRTEKVKENDVYGIYGKMSTIKNNKAINYIKKCEKQNKNLIKEVEKIKEKVIVWGVGEHTRLIFPALNNIAYFVDSDTNYIGKKLNGYDIKNPVEITEDYPIIISSAAHQEEIYLRLLNLKIKNEVITFW